MESSFSSTPAPRRFSATNLSRPASKSNTRQTERLMLLLVAFNQRSIANPSVNRRIIFQKCSYQSDQHPQPGFRVMRTVTLFAPPWLDAFFSIIQSAWSNSVTADELSGCHKRNSFKLYDGKRFSSSFVSLTERHFSEQRGTKYLVVINKSWCDAVGSGQQPWICDERFSHEWTVLSTSVDSSLYNKYFLNDIKTLPHKFHSQHFTFQWKLLVTVLFFSNR